MSAVRTFIGEEHALLLSALESPEDITRRLIFADWLEERGDLRGEWLRTTCQQQETKSAGDSTRAEALAKKADGQRSKIHPDWAALLDAADHFTIMLTAEIVKWLRDSGAEGHPLKQLQLENDLTGVKPGDHVYPIQLDKGRINVLARIRVAHVRERTNPFTNDEFLPRRVRELMHLYEPGFFKIVEAADGSRVQFGRALPLTVVERLRYRSKRAERGLSSLKGGLLTNSTTIQGVFKLTHSSACDVGLCIYAPELLQR